MPSRIEHIAITAKDNAKVAEFYKTVFGMQEVFVQPTRNGRSAYYLTDGHINLAILPGGPNSSTGIAKISCMSRKPVLMP